MKNRPRIIPVPCPHCGKPVYRPPAFLEVLDALHIGREKMRKLGDGLMTKAQIGHALKVTRERAGQLVGRAEASNALEMPFGRKKGATACPRLA